MPATPLHVVLGAGPAGTALTAELRRQGLRVRHVSRGNFAESLPDVVTVHCDVSAKPAAISATEGAEVIYNCLNVPYHVQRDLLPGLTDSVITAAATHRARLVVLGTLYPYGKADGHAITEDTPWQAQGTKGRLRASLDRRYLEAHRRGALRASIGRAADFFGPGVIHSSLGGAFFPGAITGGPVLGLGDLSLPHSYTYIRDVARGLAALGQSSVAEGRVWHLPTRPALPTAEVHRMVQEIIGQPLIVDRLEAPVPYGPFDAQFMKEYEELFYQHQIPQNMVSSTFEQTFGIAPTPWREALEETIAWYEERILQGVGSHD